MAKIYYKRIKAGIMTIDEVPKRWRAAVQAMLDEGEAEGVFVEDATETEE